MAGPARFRAIRTPSLLSLGSLGHSGGRGNLGTRTSIDTTTKSKATSGTGTGAKTTPQAKADASTAANASTTANAGTATNYRWKERQSTQLFSTPAVPNADPEESKAWRRRYLQMLTALWHSPDILVGRKSHEPCRTEPTSFST